MTPALSEPRPASTVTVIGSEMNPAHCWAARLNAASADRLAASVALGLMTIWNNPRCGLGATDGARIFAEVEAGENPEEPTSGICATVIDPVKPPPVAVCGRVTLDPPWAR